jgi:ribosomal protein S18 acetylase RimI-like enzyme
VIVRLATVEDAEALAVVQVRSWQEAYRGLIPQEYLDQRDPSRRRLAWRQWVEDARAPAATLVAEDEAGDIVGFVSVSSSRDPDADPEVEGEIQAIYLLPEYWGQGLGRLLMEAGLQRLDEARYHEVTLWVLESNRRARRFYEAGGWHADGSMKTDSSRGFSVSEVRYRQRRHGATSWRPPEH